MTTRRDLLALGAGAFSFSLIPVAQLGAATQVLGIYRRGVGEAVVTALLDGYVPLGLDLLQGSDPQTNARALAAQYLSGSAVETSINAYLIEIGDRRIMVDGGAAGAFGPTAGRLVEAVAAADIAPESVDTVFVTHLHPDHVGILAAEGEATFANATLVTHAAEAAFWTDDANFAGADDQTLTFVAAARAALAPYAERTERIEDGAEIAPGVTALHLPGHTPGHSGLLVESAGESLLLWADLIHIGPVQFARPDVTIAFDTDPAQAAMSRARLLDRVVADGLEVAGSHLDFPSFGRVERLGAGYRFHPSRWDHAL